MILLKSKRHTWEYSAHIRCNGNNNEIIEYSFLRLLSKNNFTVAVFTVGSTYFYKNEKTNCIYFIVVMYCVIIIVVIYYNMYMLVCVQGYTYIYIDINLIAFSKHIKCHEMQNQSRTTNSQRRNSPANPTTIMSRFICKTHIQNSI